ncbi:MAG: HAD family hydrolase [Bacillota bacterium]
MACWKDMMAVVSTRAGVLFDLDGTLYDLERPMRLALKAIAPEHLREVIEDRFWNCYFSRENSQPDDVNQFVGVILEAAVGEPGWKSRGGELMELFLSQVAPHRGVTEFLAELASRDVPMGIVTNGPMVFQMAKLRRLGLDRWFNQENLFAPGGLVEPKPSPGIFQQACSALGLDPRRSVFVGDNPYTDSGAVDAGMVTVLVQPQSQCGAALQRPPTHEDVELSRRLSSPRLHRVLRFEEAARFVKCLILG